MRSFFRSFRFLAAVSIISASLLLAACDSILKNRPADPFVDDLAKAANISESMTQKAAAFKTAVASRTKECSAIFAEKTFILHKTGYNTLAARCAILGLTDVYIPLDRPLFSSEKDPLAELAFLTAALHKRGVRAHAMFEDQEAAVSADKLAGELARVEAVKNKEVPGSGFDGVSMCVLPNEIGVKKTSRGLIYRWSENSYGAGKDNDQIMKLSLAALKKLKAGVAGKNMRTSQMLATFYSKEVAAGDLSAGKTDEYLDSCDHVMIRAFSSDPEEVLNFYEDELKAMNSRKDSILVCLRITSSASDTSDKGFSHAWKKWDAFLADMTQIINKSSQYQDFRGLVFQNYAGLEKMWE